MMNKKRRLSRHNAVPAAIALLLIALFALIASCALQNPFDPTAFDFTPPTITIYGVEDGVTYISTSIYVDTRDGVEYTTWLDNIDYTQHDTITRNGYHEFKVTARRISNGLTRTKRVRFNIDNLVNVTNVFPETGTTGVSRDTDMLIVFDKELDTGVPGLVTLYEEETQFTLQGGVNCTMIVSGHMLTIDPWDDLVPVCSYGNIGISGFRTESGIDVAYNDTKYSFDTSGLVSVTTPNGGETYDQGDPCSITWVSDLGGTVDIELLKNGVPDHVIASDEANDGSFTWNVPGAQAVSGAYTIRVSSVEYDHVMDTGDAPFSVVAPDSIVLVSPNGGETFLAGDLMPITWTSNIGGLVDIHLYKGGVLDSTIISATADDGVHSFTIPGGQAEGADYTVRIEALTGSRVDFSDAEFSIEDPNTGFFTGIVVDSANNTAIDNATVQVYDLSDVLLDTVSTDSGGEFQTAAFGFGGYRIAISKAGFTPYTNDSVTISRQGENNLGVIPLTIDLPAGELKFFLKWIDEPRDLDFHLTGPTAHNLGVMETGPADRYHIYYAGKLRFDEARGEYVSDDTWTTRLEYDDTGQDRFETLYFKTGAVNGLLTLTVHNYSRGAWYADGGQRPVVQVFIGRDAPYPDTIHDIVFPASANRDGNVSGHFWKVCQVEYDVVDGHTVTEVNEMATWSWDSYKDKLTMDWGSGGIGITLRMTKDVGIGNAIFFSGSCAALTSWGTGVQGTWTTGNTWEVMIADPGAFEWKVRKGISGGAGDIWEMGDNHNQSDLHPGFNGGF
jgi:hypothetical protein